MEDLVVEVEAAAAVAVGGGRQANHDE